MRIGSPSHFGLSVAPACQPRLQPEWLTDLASSDFQCQYRGETGREVHPRQSVPPTAMKKSCRRRSLLSAPFFCTRTICRSGAHPSCGSHTVRRFVFFVYTQTVCRLVAFAFPYSGADKPHTVQRSRCGFAAGVLILFFFFFAHCCLGAKLAVYLRLHWSGCLFLTLDQDDGVRGENTEKSRDATNANTPW